METIFVVNTNKVMSENTRQSMQDAARRWDCDYVEITEHWLNDHHSAVKLLAFDLCPHDRIFVLDSDTVVRSDTPNPFKMFDSRFLYAVKNQQPHYPPAYNVNVQIAERDILKIMSLKGIENLDVKLISRDFCNAGVVLINRTYHEELYKLAFNLFTDTHTQWWDQIPLNLAIYSQLGGYHDLGQDWNYQFPRNMSNMTAYIYHFAGDPSRYDRLGNVNWLRKPSDIKTRDELHTLINQMGLKVGIEIGVQEGLYSEYLLQHTDLDLNLVDTWKHMDDYHDIANVTDDVQEQVYQRCLHRLSRYSDRINIIRDFSINAAKQFADNSLDFIYIDANHVKTYEDLQVWYPKLRKGGLIAGHDFLDGPDICGSAFTVKSDVLRYLRDNKIKGELRITDEAWPTWYLKDG